MNIPKSPKLSNSFFFLTSFLMILLIWSILTYGRIVSSIFLPDPISTFSGLIHLFSTERLQKDILTSLFRVSIGFLLALGIGFPIGIFTGLSEKTQTLIKSNLTILRYIPIASFIPLAILWFGVSDIEKTFLIFIGVLPYAILYSSVVTGNVEIDFIEVARTFQATKKQIFFMIVAPRIAPELWDIARIEFGGAWSLVILSEVVAANSGLGYRLVLAQRFLHTNEIIALIVIIGLIGITIDFVFEILRYKLFPWIQKVEKGRK